MRMASSADKPIREPIRTTMYTMQV